MDKSMENGAFFTGVSTGILLYQQRIVTAHERKEHILIDGNVYYIQSGRERLQEMLDKICR